MRRYTRLSLLLGVLAACVGMAGLHRVARRTAYRFRVIQRVMDRSHEDATELRHWSRKGAA